MPERYTSEDGTQRDNYSANRHELDGMAKAKRDGATVARHTEILLSILSPRGWVKGWEILAMAREKGLASKLDVVALLDRLADSGVVERLQGVGGVNQTWRLRRGGGK